MSVHEAIKHFVIRFFRTSRFMIFFVGFLFLGTCVVPLSLPQNVEKTVEQTAMTIDGQILYPPMDSGITYLIDSSGAVNHTWSSSYFPGIGVRWLGDGTILRSIRVGVSGTGGAGGGVQRVEWDGTVTWDFRYNTDGHLSHHDIMPLSNGNVLMIAWETKTREEAIAAGRNPSYLMGNIFMPDHIIEVQPTGPTTGAIVWEWHVWDHLIQDYDASKENYGAVADHPELVDINFSPSDKYDWLHTNSIDYLERFDQIMISVHNLHEIWVIDHSTTTAEAASHSGGNSGKGGDLLYRWGNPRVYRAGSTSDQQLFSQHDATWIDEGCPGAGNILVFNNGVNRPAGRYSSVDELIPPVDSSGCYSLTPGSAYGPLSPTWQYVGSPPTSFYAAHISGAQRLIDGNTLICNGETGKFIEVSLEGETVWQYTNYYPAHATNDVFKIVYIPFEEPSEPTQEPRVDAVGSLSWTDIQPGATVIGSFQVQNIGNISSLLNWTLDTSLVTWGTWSFNPESGDNLAPDNGLITVQVSLVAPDEEDREFEGYLRVENRDNVSDFDVVSVSLITPLCTSREQTIVHSNLFNVRQLFFPFKQRYMICNSV